MPYLVFCFDVYLIPNNETGKGVISAKKEIIYYTMKSLILAQDER